MNIADRFEESMLSITEQNGDIELICVNNDGETVAITLTRASVELLNEKLIDFLERT